jgi:hypothetical protein
MEEYCSENNVSCKNEFTNIILDEELKKLVYKEMIIAQDLKSPFYLSKLRSYENYHNNLKEHFIRFYGKKPTQTDNLAFMLLLTYPKVYIERFNNFTDLKLAFNNRLEESDFESSGFTIYQGFGEANCICNEDIMNVHIFRNKYSGMNIQLGSVCNSRYGLISKNNPAFKSTCKKINEHREKEKERKEGKPEGFYENERQLKKQEKEETKFKGLEEKEKKKMEKEVNKLNKTQNDSVKIKNCIFCNKEGIHKTYEVGICSACVPCKIKLNHKNINYSIKNISIYNKCICCETGFVNVKNDSKELCNNCKSIWSLERCKMCPEKFIKHKEINDLYCLDCDDKIISCTDCNKKILKPSERCKDCQRRFTNNLCVIKCQECDEEVEINKYDKKFKKHCNDCYKSNLQYVDCISCNIPFKRLIRDTWRKSCSDCYYKSK